MKNNIINIKQKLYQKTIIDSIRQIDWNISSDFPLVVEFDPTTACNLACPDCISRDLLNQGFFTRKRIKELTAEMIDAGVKAVILIGGGEPLIHPEIDWVINQLGQNNVQIGITTNGVLIHKHIELIAEYANWVRVSVDAASSDVFKKIRPSVTGKSLFNEVIDNMKQYSSIKKGRLGYSFMIYSEGDFDSTSKHKTQFFSNISEISKGAKLAKEIGCDYYEIKPMYNINHYLIKQKKDLIEQVKEEINKAYEYSDDQFKVILATKLYDALNEQDNTEIKKYTHCAVAQLRTLVTPSGVYVCPYFRGREDMKIGDVRNESFLDMWNGNKRKAVMKKCNPSKICQMHCIRHDSNLILENIINGQKIDIVDDFDFFI